jgi:hypothetical protein
VVKLDERFKMLENVELIFKWKHSVKDAQCAKVTINSCISGEDVDKIINLFQENIFKFDETTCDIQGKGSQ